MDCTQPLHLIHNCPWLSSHVAHRRHPFSSPKLRAGAVAACTQSFVSSSKIFVCEFVKVPHFIKREPTADPFKSGKGARISDA